MGGAGAGRVLSSYSRGLLTGLTCLAAGHGCYRVRGLHYLWYMGLVAPQHAGSKFSDQGSNQRSLHDKALS